MRLCRPVIGGMDTALLLLDLQQEFLGEGGGMPVARDQDPGLVSCVNRLVASSPGRYEVIYVGNEFSRWDYPANWFRRHAAVQGTPGCRIDERIHVVNNHYFAKRSASAFSHAGLGRFLATRGIWSLAVAGVLASFCVRATCRAALRMGQRVTVLSDGVADRSDRALQRALDRMAETGVTVEASRDFLQRMGVPSEPCA